MARLGSKEFIEKPNDWPNWPLLPVVNRQERADGMPEAGIIHAAALTRIRLVNLFDDQIKAKWETCEKLEFDDVQALVDAGWEPD